jgi:hypothetical protein
MNGCVYHKAIDWSAFEDCRFNGFFNAFHFIVKIGIHKSQLVHEITVVQHVDGIREPIANSYPCNVMEFLTYLHHY